MINITDTIQKIKQQVFNGELSVRQTEGITAVLTEWNKRQWVNLHWLAYMLATIKWETDNTMWPIEEYGHGRGHSYGIPDSVTGQTYYGRGFVQLTWKYNYANQSKALGVDLVNHPEKALELPIATDILFNGMSKGAFTGRKLSDYFNDKITDWVNARRIINGTDQANTIAHLAQKFNTCLHD